FLNANGKLFVFANERSGHFRAREIPSDLGQFVALAAADVNDDGRIDLLALRNDGVRSEEHTSELQSQSNLVCRLLLEKKNNNENPSATLCRLRRLPRSTPPPNSLSSPPPPRATTPRL